MMFRRLVFAALCCILASEESVSAARLKGEVPRLARRELQTRKGKGRDSKTQVYTWQSGDEPVIASVSRSKYDAMEKMKTNKETAADDDDEAKDSKHNKNRYPDASDKENDDSPTPKNTPKGGREEYGGASYNGASYPGGINDGGSYANSKKNGDDKESDPLPSPKGGPSPNGDGGTSYNGASYPGGSYQASKKTKETKKAKSKKSKKDSKMGPKKIADKKYGGGGTGDADYDDVDSKKSSNGEYDYEKPDTDAGTDPDTDGGTVPVTPSRPPLGQDEPLTGVAVSRFALLYSIDHDEGEPETNDYEAVHEKTYTWLYTIMFQEFGNQMKNLLTDDTSNIYVTNQPVTIEYASVVLFAQDDPNIPSQDELDELVVSAFTGSNGQIYLDDIQSLPRSNPFHSTESLELQTVVPGTGRGIIGSIGEGVSSNGMMPPLIAAALLCVVLAGGAAVYKYKYEKEGKNDKGLDFHSSSEETETMGETMEEFTQLNKTIAVNTAQNQDTWEQQTLQDESRDRMSESERAAQDPDLARFSDVFDDDAPRSTRTNEDSQYSIEDFVNEAEKSLLGIRIRYSGQDPPADSKDADVEHLTDADADITIESCTALVPAHSSALLPTELVPIDVKNTEFDQETASL